MFKEPRSGENPQKMIESVVFTEEGDKLVALDMVMLLTPVGEYMIGFSKRNKEPNMWKMLGKSREDAVKIFETIRDESRKLSYQAAQEKINEMASASQNQNN